MSYDPFVHHDVDIATLPKVNLLTAFEVFEHVAQPQQLMRNIDTLLVEDGLVLFSTLLCDGHIARNRRLDWWYASPRNGHISLFSRNSLVQLAGQFGYTCASFSDGYHALFRQVPAWARHLIA